MGIENSPKQKFEVSNPVRGVFSTERLERMNSVIKKIESPTLNLRIVAEAGGEYSHDGNSSIVPVDQVYVEITGFQEDINKFWEAVDSE